jgi:hypothetical protein
MSVRAFTKDAGALLTRIKKLIDQKHIATWRYDSAGDFTHTAAQWNGKAWFRPQVEADKLRFVILKTEGLPLTREIFAIYHGRFIEMLIVHVANDFTHAIASANPVNDEPALEG